MEVNFTEREMDILDHLCDHMKMTRTELMKHMLVGYQTFTERGLWKEIRELVRKAVSTRKAPPCGWQEGGCYYGRNCPQQRTETAAEVCRWEPRSWSV